MAKFENGRLVDEGFGDIMGMRDGGELIGSVGGRVVSAEKIRG